MPKKRNKSLYLRLRVCQRCGREEQVRKDSPSAICKSCASRHAAAVQWSRPRLKPDYLKSCLRCGGEFKTTPSADAKFCSLRCRKQHTQVERVCKHCCRTFVVSRSKLSGKTNASANFCARPCYDAWRCKPDRVSGRGSRWKHIRTEILRKQSFCAMCGTFRQLQIHHIVPFRLTFDNAERNLIPLCRCCHKRVEWITTEVEMLGCDADTLFLSMSLALRARQRLTLAVLRKLHARAA